MLWGVSALFCFVFQKKLIFPEFQLVEIVFRPIKIAIKNVCDSLSVSIGARLVLDQLKHFRPIKSVFRSIENRVKNFFKTDFHVFKLTFSKVFQLFLSLSIRLGQGSNPFFCHFPPFFLQGFSLPRPVRPLYPSFCIYFHFSCIKSCIIWEISNLLKFLGFLMNQAFSFTIDQWVFVGGCYKHDLWCLI